MHLYKVCITAKMCAKYVLLVCISYKVYITAKMCAKCMLDVCLSYKVCITAKMCAKSVRDVCILSIALERIGQTTLGLPASRPVKAPGSSQHRSVSLTPHRSCKTQSAVRKSPCAFLAYAN